LKLSGPVEKDNELIKWHFLHSATTTTSANFATITVTIATEAKGRKIKLSGKV
jgi:hypothetical protein